MARMDRMESRIARDHREINRRFEQAEIRFNERFDQMESRFHVRFGRLEDRVVAPPHRPGN